jgi:hypothetical protein
MRMQHYAILQSLTVAKFSDSDSSPDDAVLLIGDQNVQGLEAKDGYKVLLQQFILKGVSTETTRDRSQI